MSQLLLSQLRVERNSGTVALVLALCVAIAFLYGALRIGYVTEVVSAETPGLVSEFILYGSVLGGGVIAGVLGYWDASAPVSVLSGLALPVGMCLGSLGTVLLGFGYYDSSPAILFAGLLLFCSVVNAISWGIGTSVS